jgi:hypothetical protein
MPSYDTNFFPDFRGQDYARGKKFLTFRSPVESSADQTNSLGGANNPYTYGLGWRVLTSAQAAALSAARLYIGEGTLFFLEWRETAESALDIGTGTGVGVISFDLRCRLSGDSAAAAGLEVKRDGVTLVLDTDYSVLADTGNNYVEHKVIIVAAANVNGAAYTATWTAARRRRAIRLLSDSFQLEERPRTPGIWRGSVTLEEA